MNCRRANQTESATSYRLKILSTENPLYVFVFTNSGVFINLNLVFGIYILQCSYIVNVVWYIITRIFYLMRGIIFKYWHSLTSRCIYIFICIWIYENKSWVRSGVTTWNIRLGWHTISVHNVVYMYYYSSYECDIQIEEMVKIITFIILQLFKGHA